MKKIKTTHTASEARDNLYSLIRSADEGIHHEIFLRELDEPVILMGKAEYESWKETLDLLQSPEEVKIIRAARNEKEVLTEKELRKKLGL